MAQTTQHALALPFKGGEKESPAAAPVIGTESHILNVVMPSEARISVIVPMASACPKIATLAPTLIMEVARAEKVGPHLLRLS